jgi:hypothetical protein
MSLSDEYSKENNGEKAPWLGEDTLEKIDNTIVVTAKNSSTSTSSSTSLEERINNIYLAKKIFGFIDRNFKFGSWFIISPWVFFGIIAAIVHILYEYFIKHEFEITELARPLPLFNFIINYIVPKIIIILFFGYFYIFPGLLFLLFKKKIIA